MSERRRRLTEEERLEVLKKTNWRCAYCGLELGFDSFQVDHVVPMRSGGEDEISNMLPACRSCNHYKRGNSLEGWRKILEAMPETLRRDCYTYRQAVKFGLVEPRHQPVVFYFERMKQHEAFNNDQQNRGDGYG